MVGVKNMNHMEKALAAAGILTAFVLALGCGGGGGGGGGPAAVVVVTSVPANNATGVALTAAVVITFNQAMNQASVVGAWSIVPNVAGAFSWNGAGTVLTFTPNAALAGNTLYTVTIGTGATGTAGGTLAAPFIVSFTTQSGPFTQLPGPPGDPANTHIPPLDFPAPSASDFTSVDADLTISFREFLLEFKSATTVQQANTLLAGINATVVGTIEDFGVLLVRVSTADLNALMALLSTLKADPIVEEALPEMGTTVESLPPHNVSPGLWNWAFPRPEAVPPVGPTDGNWGLEMIRAPQMWNLDTYWLRRTFLALVSAGVVDAGFTDNLAAAGPSTHPDFTTADNAKLLQIEAQTPTGEHGTMVAGIIGAAFDNRAGIEGVNPWIINIYGRNKRFSVTDRLTWGRVLRDILILLRDNPDVRAVNNSYGLSGFYKSKGINPVAYEFGDTNGDNDHADLGEWAGVNVDGVPGNDTYASLMRVYGDYYNRKAAAFAGGYRTNFLIVASAGNAGAAYQSVDNSPIANAAVRHGGHFLSIESIDQNNAASGFSDIGGSVSAPGDCIRSTELINGVNYDRAGCAWSDGFNAIPVDQSYGTNSGTSFASPHAVGLITALWSLNPGLDFAEVRTLMTDAAYTVATTGGTQRRIDAFSAAMGIDVIIGDKNLQTALVDVDDGTVDGNQRTVRDNNGAVTGQFTNITTTDGRRGDGVIDMSDLRAYRDAVAQAGLEDWDGDGQADMQQGRVQLDGDPNHPKKDLNADGCVVNQGYAGGAPNCAANGVKENIYPRFDFNGDGRMDPYKNFAFKNWAQPATDLDVLRDVWPASPTLTEGYSADDLLSLVPNPQNAAAGSGDVEFRVDPALSIGPAGTYDEMRITITMLGGPRTRSIMAPATSLLWTLPIDQSLPVTIEGYKSNALVGPLCPRSGSQISPLLHAEDRVVPIQSCGPIVSGMSFNHYAFNTNGSIYSETVIRNTNCPMIDPGQSCRLTDRVSNTYTWTEYDLLITRVGTSEYTMTGYATSHADPPPLGAATGYAHSQAHNAISIRIPIPTPGQNTVTVNCIMNGDVAIGPPEEPVKVYASEGINLNPPFERPDECFWGDVNSVNPPEWVVNATAVRTVFTDFFFMDSVFVPDARAGRGVDYPSIGKNYSFFMENRLDINLHITIAP